MTRLAAAVLAPALALLLPLSATAAPSSESDALVAPAEITRDDFFAPGIAPVVNPGGRDVTIVYFMDYQCPSCRRYTPDVERVMREDRGVRWIVRDVPMLSPQSDKAARLALAATYQGRHDGFHRELMAVKGQLSDARIRAAATRAGIDWPRLEADLARHRSAIEAQIARNHELANATGVTATPAFIIGDTQANGALDYRALKAEIADARSARGITARPAATPATPAPTAPAPEAESAAEESAIPTAVPPDAAAAKAPPAPPQPAPVQRPAAEPGPSYWPWIAALVALLALAGFALRRRR